LQGFFLVLHPSINSAPLVSNLNCLVLEHVSVYPKGLALMLSHCHQLEDLKLLRTELIGSSQPLSVLSQLPSLALELDVQEERLPEGERRLGFLEHLGSCLTSLEVHTGEDEDLDEQLIRVTATHLHRLRFLTINNDNGSYPEAAVFDQLANSPAAQTLEVLDINVTLPTMAVVAKLLAMPKLEAIEQAAFPETNDDLSGFQMAWPEGKPPMELYLFRANIQQLAALPLQHFNHISLDQLRPAPDASRAQREAALRALLAVAHKCPSFTFNRFTLDPDDQSQAAGISALGPDCPFGVTFEDLGFRRIELEKSDMQGVVAAWGSILKNLSFSNCTLSAGAWAAINPTNFPVLQSIEIRSPKGNSIAPYLTALCLEWPEAHPLNISLYYFAGAEAVADTVRSILAARGRQNPTVELHGAVLND
jgi:hypothetical protein